MFLDIFYSTERKFNVDKIHAAAKERRRKRRRKKICLNVLDFLMYAGFLLLIKGDF